MKNANRIPPPCAVMYRLLNKTPRLKTDQSFSGFSTNESEIVTFRMITHNYTRQNPTPLCRRGYMSSSIVAQCRHSGFIAQGVVLKSGTCFLSFSNTNVNISSFIEQSSNFEQLKCGAWDYMSESENKRCKYHTWF